MSSHKHIRLTPERRQQIVAAIRAGSFPHVAAQAFGVSAATFAGWLRRGRDPQARDPYRSLARAVEQAHAQARLKAEMGVLQEEPKTWLEHGPGRDRADNPGWSTAVKPAVEGVAAGQVLDQPEVVEMIRAFQAALIDHPELRQRVSKVLIDHGVPLSAESHGFNSWSRS